jgi:hypothetical protein
MGLEQRLVAAIEHPQLGVAIPYGVLGLAQDTYAGPSATLSHAAGASLTVNYLCRWSQLAAFCEAALGVNYTTEDGERLSRSKPLQAPIRGLQGMYAVRCGPVTGVPGISWTGGSIGATADEIHLPCWRAGKSLIFAAAEADDGDGAYVVSTTDFIEYEFAVVPVEFAPLPYRVLDDDAVPAEQEWLRYTAIERNPRVELLNVKGGTLYWIDDPPLAKPQPVPTPDIPIRVQSVDYAATWHNVPFVITNFDSFVGYSNSNDAFLAGHPQVPDDGFGKDRMLLLGVREVILPSPFTHGAGLQKNLYQYTFYFQDRFNKHNNTLRRKGEGVATTFAYNDYSFTGRVAETNAQRAIKHANLAQLFLARS